MEDNTERRMKRSADGKKRSSSGSLVVHGEIEAAATLLAVQLALAFVRLQQRAKTKNETLDVLHHALGLPPLNKRRKESAENMITGNLRSVALPTPSLGVPRGGRFQQLSSYSCNSSTAQPRTVGELGLIEDEGCIPDEGYAPAVTDLQWKEDVRRPFQEEYEPEQSLSKEDLEVQNDEEGLAYTSDDREGSLFSLDQSSVRGAHDQTSGTFNLDNLTARSISDDLIQSRISSTRQVSKSQPDGPVFLEHGKEESWPSGIEFCKVDDTASDSEVNNFHHSSRATMAPNDAVSVPQSKVLLSSMSADASMDGGPEQRQPDSLLLWPFGLAVEAIAFQVRLVAQALSLVAMLYDWCTSFASNRVRDTWQVKDRATEALNEKVAMITNVPPKFTENSSLVLKRAGWGCLAAAYVCLLLSILLFPALLLDYVFLSRIVEDPVSVKEPLHFDYTVPNPTAVVSLQPFIGKLKSGPDRARALPVLQKIHITVFLTLPESDYNRKLGIFQLTSELLSEDNEIIKSSSRPCILRFHSSPIRIIKSFLIGLPSLLGIFTESQTLEINMMEFKEETIATHSVKIVVQSKAGMPLGQGIPEIYSAHVHIESRLPWLKNIMWNWKWTAFIWTGLAFYVTEIFMILCCCRQVLLPLFWLSRNDETKEDEGGRRNPEIEDTSRASRIGFQKEDSSNQRRSPYDQIPIARAVAYRKEHKLS